MNLTLLRLYSDNDAITGILLVDKIPRFTTLELPWKDNRRNISCIFDGTYTCLRIKHPKFGLTLRLERVEGRSGIILHSGNYPQDTKGCILIGSGFTLSGKGLTQSKIAMINLRKLIKDEKEIKLRIMYDY